MFHSRLLITILFIIIGLIATNIYGQSNDDDEEKISSEMATLKKQYGKNIENLKDFYWRYLTERMEQVKVEILKEKSDAVVDNWRELLGKIEILDGKKEYASILSQITLFDTHKIKAIEIDKKRLLTYFTKLDSEDRVIYEKVKKKETEILLEEFLNQSKELAVASKFVEMRETFLQLIAENPGYNKNEQLIEISRLLNVLLASRNQAFFLLKLSIGKKMHVRGIEVTIESFDGETLEVKDYQNKKKSYLFSEFHLVDYLSIIGLKSFDGEFIYQNGLKYYLEGQYQKAHEALLMAQKKGINCRTFLFAAESKLGDMQRATLLEASLLIDNKKFREAELIVLRMLKEKPNDLEALFMQGEIRVGQNRISEAYGLFEDLHKKFPKHEETLQQLAELGHKLKLSDAYLWSAKLLEIYPEDKEQLMIVCKEMQKQEKGDKFLELALKVQKLNPNLIEPNLLLAEAYAFNKKFPEALEVYAKMLKEKPTQWDAQQGVGETMCLQGKSKEALTYYENLLVTLKSEKKKDSIRKRIKELLNK